MIYVESKFRNLFKAKLLLGFIIGFFLSCYLILNAEYYKITNPIFIFCFCGAILGLVVVIRSMTLYKIVINDIDIEKRFLIMRKSKKFLFKDIVDIEVTKLRQVGKGGNISDGYVQSALMFKNGSYLIISPDEFENYGELMYHIKLKVKHVA